MKANYKNNNYPVFEDNQVLSSTHLNQVFNYLDEQERLTRANLIGIGIVSGLEIRFDPAETPTTIHLSKGCGITSEGHLIMEPEDVSLVSYIEYSLPAGLIYSPFRDASGKQYPLWELFPEGEPNATQLTSSGIFLDDKAVLLFLELKQENLRNCSANNCDDLGAKVTATIRRLLVTKDDLKVINDSSLSAYQESRVKIPEVPMRRIIFSSQENLREYQLVYKKFFIQKNDEMTVIQRLTEAIEKAYETMITLFPDLSPFNKEKLISIFTFIVNSDTIAIQYYYDLLRDLTAAYHELCAALSGRLAICLLNNELFPKHLVLGALSGRNKLELRTFYYPSPASFKPQLNKLRFLFDRLNHIVLNFNVPVEDATVLKITPSLYGSKYLSGKSLPFYYRYEMRKYWDIRRIGEEKFKEILSWHDDIGNPDYIRNPLIYDLEPYNFFRVEGILGKNIVTVSSKLSEYLKSAQLPFSVLHVNADKAGSFLEKHYAIDHQAGTPRGGTLVVVHRDSGPQANLVVADFALPYRIEEKEGRSLGRVTVKECDYEWFDSIKHISSLARREYRFPPRPAVKANSSQRESQEREKIALAEYYVIVIYLYTIKDTTIVNTPVHIKVPISELINGYLSAIARKLNEQFPMGVVFDHKKDTNKLHIRYFSDHTFRIELGGMQGNQIRYAYTSEGIYRWQKNKWESLNDLPNFRLSESRLLNEYRVDEYLWLQEDSYYNADYTTPAPLPTADELIRWEKMIKGRAPKRIDDLPIQDILRKIMHAINDQYNVGSPQVTVVLVGSWANGSWVSRDWNKDRYPIDFFDLRKKITGKEVISISGRGMSGYSDINLLVEITNNNPSVEELRSLLESVNVSSGYAINIILGKKDAQNGLPL